MKTTITLFFVFSFVVTNAQISVSDGVALRIALLKEVNTLRDSLGLERLEEDGHLQKAALDHSKYMVRYKELTHEERGRGSTVMKRVKRAGGSDFEYVGENILYKEVKPFKLKKNEINSLAHSMYLQWRSSPPHYRNMINPQYSYGDIGLGLDSRTRRIYATQVFGSKGVRVEGQLSKNGFGISVSSQECEGIHQNLMTNVGNSLSIRNDTIFLRYHNISIVKRFLSGPQDGFAIDLISSDQLPCDAPNILDMSKVYDGIMLEPVYRDEVIRRNTAKGEHRIITHLGIVPETLRGQELALGMVHIKDRKMCLYTIPAYAPSRAYVLEPFKPTLVNPQMSLTNEVIINSEELEFEFDRGALIPSNRPILEGGHIYDRIHSVKILSYSSVEGSTDQNIRLHEERAKFIERYIRERVLDTDFQADIGAEENWRMMDFQLRYLFADSLLELSRQELKSLIASGDNSLDWDKLLFEQRSSKAFVNYVEKVNPQEFAPLLPYLNLITAVASENLPLANQALFEIYNTDSEFRSAVFESQVFDALLKQKELVQNAAALISEEYDFDREKATMFVHAWALRLDELSEGARENVLHLYSVLGYELVQEWDVSAKRLSNVIHPERLEGLINNDLPAEILLNANLTFLYYYGHTLEREGLNRSFDYVRKYMDEKSITEDQLNKLVLFFNDWSRYDLTNKYLLKSYEKGVISDENLFVVVHTLSRYQKGKYYEKYLELMRSAQKADSEKWCSWVNSEFQILRDPEIKQLFCESCR